MALGLAASLSACGTPSAGPAGAVPGADMPGPEAGQVISPGTRFVGADMTQLQTGGRAVIFSYASPLGAELQDRAPTEAELAGMRQVCGSVRQTLVSNGAPDFDTYLFQFGSGEGPVAEQPPESRSTLAFDGGDGCSGVPRLARSA